MEFIPLHFGDRLTVINPRGTIGVVTLWSKVEYVVERFRQAGVDLDPATSPIAVFGNLYGNGLREMLRNLLYNPQIRVLLICGYNRSGSMQELISFFDLGLEPVEGSLVTYRSPLAGLIVAPARIAQTSRIIDNLVSPELFSPLQPPLIQFVGDPQEQETSTILIKDFFARFNPEPFPGIARVEVPLPEVELDYFPSNPRTHQISRDKPLDAWIELLYILSRFGHRVTLRKGDRLELQNVKVVVGKPEFEEKRLQKFSFDLVKLKKYQKDIVRSKIRPDKPSLKGQTRLPHWVQLRPDETYNYSERLRTHFGMDGLEACMTHLRKDSEDRKAYFTLWDNTKDLKAPSGHPCFVSLFFRKFEKRLTLTATFRTHNALDGWLINFYGLMAIQNWVSKRVNLPSGAITVISHSISLDPKELDRAMIFISQRSRKVFRMDPMGYFRVTLDGNNILVEHRFEDVTLKEYRGKTAVSLQHQIARDVAVSDVNHAIYLGRQLAKAEMALKGGQEFVQD
ncbi:MAG: thymidylate synthase [Desulfobaccales bacterium]